MERNKPEAETAEGFRMREQQWRQERETLLKTIGLLEAELGKQKAINLALQRKGKHKRASSEEQTFIFNQTNISSYFPVVVVKNHALAPKATLRSHLDSVRALLFAGPHLLSAGEDATLKVWHRDKLEVTLRQHLGPVYAMAASEEFVFTAGAEGVVRKWELPELLKGGPPCFEEEYHEEPIWSLALNAKRGLLLTSSADQSFCLFRNSKQGLETLWRSRVEENTPTVVEWVADNRFATGFRLKESVGVFDSERGELSWEYSFEGRGASSQANCLKLGARLSMLAAGHEDHFLRFFDPNSSKPAET
jgi:WD40 repeat protein